MLWADFCRYLCLCTVWWVMLLWSCVIFFLLLDYFYLFIVLLFFLSFYVCLFIFFFFSSRRRHTRSWCDWSSECALPISLFKVLFKFPSLYLFAIGLGVIFSLTRSLPGTLDSTLKLSDSGKRSAKSDAHLTGLAPSMGCGHCQVGLWQASEPWKRPFQTQHSAWPGWPAVLRWAFPVSFAITKGIIVIFFSSVY